MDDNEYEGGIIAAGCSARAAALGRGGGRRLATLSPAAATVQTLRQVQTPAVLQVQAVAHVAPTLCCTFAHVSMYANFHIYRVNCWTLSPAIQALLLIKSKRHIHVIVWCAECMRTLLKVSITDYNLYSN